MKQKDTLIIAGGSDGSKLIPYEMEADIWGINDNAFRLRRFDLLFDIHNLEVIKKNTRKSDYYDCLTKLDKPIVMQDKFIEIPTSIKYPYEELVEKYGERFFSSFDYMMAYAISLGYKKILIYGIDMAVQDEYLFQRPSALYWIGFARGLGIDVEIQKDSGLNMTGLYALKASSDQTTSQLIGKIYRAKAELKEKLKDVSFHEGMFVAVNNLLEIEDLDLDETRRNALWYLNSSQKEAQKYQDEIDSCLLELSDILKCEVVIPENEILLRSVKS